MAIPRNQRVPRSILEAVRSVGGQSQGTGYLMQGRHEDGSSRTAKRKKVIPKGYGPARPYTARRRYTA